MNKVITINLGGYPFTIDEDAYAYLERYLRVIHRHFKESDGYDDITHDIEVRLAELLQEYKAGRQIIILKDVERAVSVMGTPEDFGGEPIEGNQAEQDDSSGTDKKYRTGRRLFRNPQEQMIGGVCSGLAAYFGIPEPFWLRLAFILFTISGGFGVMLYIILWIIIPEARTAADRLAMEGEDITVSNIARIIEKQVNQLSDQISGLGKKAKKKHFSKAGGGELVDKGFRQAGEGIRKLLAFLVRILGPVGMFIGAILLIVLFGFWVSLLVFSVFSYPLLEFVSLNGFLAGLSLVNVFFLIGIPVLTMILTVLRLFFGAKIMVRWKRGLMVFWGINVMFLFLGMSFSARDYRDSSSRLIANEDILVADTLVVRARKIQSPGFQVGGDALHLLGDQLIFKGVKLDVVRSTDGQFRVVQENQSRGKDRVAASERAKSLDYQYTLQNNILEFPDRLLLEKGQKWRDQQVRLRIEVPQGKTIFLDSGRNLSRLINDFEMEARQQWPLVGNYWIMQADGLLKTGN